MIITGYLSEYDGNTLTIRAPFDKGYLLTKQQITECEIRLDDGRTISAEQRRKIYATMRDIAAFTGHMPDEIKALMKYEYISRTGSEYFSLSDCSVTTANAFLQFLLEFCIEQGYPLADPVLSRSPDIARMIYCCLANKVCCITGKRAQLHHVDAVGMGRDRHDIIHKGMRVLPLHWSMHREAHDMGSKSFCDKYHVFGIKLDDDLCRIWRIKAS